MERSENSKRKAEAPTQPTAPIHVKEAQNRTVCGIKTKGTRTNTKILKNLLIFNIKKSLNASNGNFKAGNIASYLSKWKEITKDKRILNTVSGARIEFEELSHIPLSQGNHSKTRENKKFRAEINHLLKKEVIFQVENTEKWFISSVIFREKKGQRFRLILNLKKFN